MDSGGVLKLGPSGLFLPVCFLVQHASRVRHGLLVLPSSYTRSWLAGAGDLGNEPRAVVLPPARAAANVDEIHGRPGSRRSYWHHRLL